MGRGRRGEALLLHFTAGVGREEPLQAGADGNVYTSV
jgi:hypothetical protein